MSGFLIKKGLRQWNQTPALKMINHKWTNITDINNLLNPLLIPESQFTDILQFFAILFFKKSLVNGCKGRDRELF